MKNYFPRMTNKLSKIMKSDMSTTYVPIDDVVDPRIRSFLAEYDDEATARFIKLKTQFLQLDPNDVPVYDIGALVLFTKKDPETIMWAVQNPEFINSYINGQMYCAEISKAIALDETRFNIAVSIARMTKYDYKYQELIESAIEVNPQLITSNLAAFVDENSVEHIFHHLSAKKLVSKNDDIIFNLMKGKIAPLYLYLRGLNDADTNEAVDLYFKYHGDVPLDEHTYFLEESHAGYDVLKRFYNTFIIPEYSLEQLIKDTPLLSHRGISRSTLLDLIDLTKPEFRVDLNEAVI